MILGSFRTKNATMGQIVTLGVTAIVLLMLWGIANQMLNTICQQHQLEKDRR